MGSNREKQNWEELRSSTTSYKSLTGESTISKFLVKGQLTTEMVTMVVRQPNSVTLVAPTIIQALQRFGNPLRWAITAVDPEEKTLSVEAVVIKSVAQSESTAKTGGVLRYAESVGDRASKTDLGMGDADNRVLG